ncbi:OmpA family protein [Ralstonia sp. 1138]|uniref:OmpA/MotB family protein n=1 Tax=Ralstonia sp. 1138 TaxID=3156423 RepID=UPI003391B13C
MDHRSPSKNHILRLAQPLFWLLAELSPELESAARLDTLRSEARTRLTTFKKASLAAALNADSIGISTKDDRIYLAFNSDEGFASGRADLMPMLARQLDRLATVLADTRGKVIVLGHTDDAPGPRDRVASNLALSTSRATAVARHLQERGIASDRLSIVGRGVKDSVGDNRTAAGRALNRRVEIVLESVPNSQPTGLQR